MALPTGNIKSIQTTDSVVHEIIPERLKNSSYLATLPALSADDIIVTTVTAQTISGAKIFSADNTYASNCGFSKATNVLSDSCFAAIRGLSTNPFFGLRCNGTNYYLQATSRGLFLGPTSSVATSWASNGDMTVRGTNQPKWNSKTLATTDQIPTVNNNTITLTQGGVTKGSFTLNQSSDQTIALDGGGAADYNDLTNKPITNIVSGTTYSEGNYYRKSVDTYLEPFMVGRTLSQGDKIYFDTTKGDEVSSLLATLPYSGGAYNLLNIGDGKGIGAVSVSGYKLLAMIDDSGGQFIGGTIIFSNRAGTPTSGLTVTAGWQNLASDGSYTWAKSGTDTILSLSADDWNGIIAGTSWNESKALTKYEIGDLAVDLSTDGVYVDVSKEKELVAFLEGLSYVEGEPAGFAICQLLQIGADSGIYAIRDATGDTTNYLACLLTEGFGVFYATGSGTVMSGTPYETTYGKGFQNLNSDNCYLYAAGQSGTGTFSIRAIVNSEWNGKFFGSNISNKEGAIYRYEGGELKRVLVEGDAAASGGSIEIPVTDVQVNGTSILDGDIANLLTNTAYSSSNKIATVSDLPDISTKMDKVNPTGTGSLSINRKDNTTIGENSVAVGINTTASAIGAFAEGNNTIASGGYSHAEGNSTKSLGNNAHAEGYGTIAKDLYSHAEGYGNQSTATITGAANATSYTLGNVTSAEIGNILFYNDIYAKVTAKSGTTITLDKTLSNTALSNVSVAVINGIAYGYGSHVEGYGNTAGGYYSHAEGRNTKAFEEYTHAEGYSNSALGKYSHVEGQNNIASGASSHAEGASTQAIGTNSHAEGHNTAAKGDYSHAEGETTYALGNHSHVEGYLQKQNLTITGDANATTYTVNSGINYVLMGSVIYRGNNWTIVTSVSGTTITVANTLSAEALSSGAAYVAWGVARGDKSHAEGSSTASGSYSHSEGYSTTAYGSYSHAEGYYTIANHKSQHVFGDYNIADSSTNASSSHGNYIEIVGNGTGNGSSRSNARTLDWSGNEWLAGGLTIGANSTISNGTVSTTISNIALKNIDNNFPHTTFTGSLEIKSDGSSWSEGIRIHPSSNGWDGIVLCDSTNTGSTGTGAKTWSIHNNEGTFGIFKNGSNTSAPYYITNTQSDGNWDIKGANYRIYYNSSTQSIDFSF